MSVRLRCLLPLLAGLVIAACVGVKSRPGNSNASVGIVTFNLYHDKADWPARRALAMAELRALRPDVIVLQEVLQHETLHNQAEDLADALGYTAYFISIDRADKIRRYGNAILTRHPVLVRDWAPLQPFDDSRTAGLLRIDIDGHPLNVYATHLHHEDNPAGARKRAEQLTDLLNFIHRTAGDVPSLVAGDFNVAAGRPELATLAAGGFDEAFTRLHPGDPSPTLNPHYFPQDARRIDHVYLQRERLLPVEARVVLDHEGAPGTWPSDHFGVYVRFRFAPPR